MNSTVEVRDIVLHVPLIFMPSDPIDSDCHRLLQIEERFG